MCFFKKRFSPFLLEGVWHFLSFPYSRERSVSSGGRVSDRGNKSMRHANRLCEFPPKKGRMTYMGQGGGVITFVLCLLTFAFFWSNNVLLNRLP